MKKFFSDLSHRTRVTLITCGCFLVLTMLILIFLMLCPIQESSSANNVNDSLVVTTVASETTDSVSETTVAATTKFNRQTTDANRTTTAAATTKSYQTEAVYNYNAYDNYDEPDDSYDYVTTTKAHYNNNTTWQTTVAPVVTQAPTVQTQPPVTAAPAPAETIPSPDDTAND